MSSGESPDSGKFFTQLKQKAVSNKSSILKFALGLIISILWLLPLLGVVVASFRPYGEIYQGWWVIEEFTLTLENFVNAWTHPTGPMKYAIPNSLLVTVPSTIVTVTLGAMIAYPLARFKFIGRKALFFVIILIMAAPAEVIMMTNYRTFLELGMLDTYIGLMLLHATWGIGWVVLFFRNYMLSIPIELEEAARIDGASRFEIFKSVILPLSGPAIVSVAVIQFTWIWNGAFFPMVVMRSTEKILAPQALPRILGREIIQWGDLAAASLMTMAVPVILYIFLQRYYKKGLTGGAIEK